MGRPTLYSQELIDVICERIACGESVRQICLDDDMPCFATIFKWLRENESFSQQYALAKEQGAEAIAEDMFEIADDGTNDYVTRKMQDGTEFEQFSSEHVQRSKLRVDTRKWYLSKIMPKKYGDRQDLNIGGSINLNITTDDADLV